MPTYKTTQRWYEDGFGMNEDIIIISDSFSDLDDIDAAIEVNIFTTPSVKKNVDVDVGVISTANMRMRIKAFAAETQDAKDAVNFILTARDKDVIIYVARVLNPSTRPITDVTDYMFRGRLDPAFEWDESAWTAGVEFSSEAVPLNEWSCTGKVIDLGVILGQKIIDLVNGTDEDGDGILTNGIKQLPDFSTWKDANVKDRLAWFAGYGGRNPDKGWRGAYYARMIRLDTLLQKLLDQAAIRTEGVSITIDYVPGATNITAYPARWNTIRVPGEGDDDATLHCRYVTFVSQNSNNDFYLIPFRIYLDDAYPLLTGGDIYGSPYVTWRIVDPFHDQSPEVPFSWSNLTLAQVLHRIAYSLGLFIHITPININELHISFSNRQELGATEFYVRDKVGASKGKISPKTTTKETGLQGASMSLCKEGPLYYRWDKNVESLSEQFTLMPNERRDDFYQQSVTYTSRPEESDKNLPLTFSPTSCLFGQGRGADGGYDLGNNGHYVMIPHNAVWKEGTDESNAQRGSKAGDREQDYGSAWIEYNREDVWTGICIKVPGRADSDGESGVEGMDILAPVAFGVANVNNQLYSFQKLGDFTRIASRFDESAYEGELTVTVPGLNGFRLTPNGASSWKHAIPGNKWIRDTVEWALIEIEYKERECELRFQHNDRFALFLPVGTVEEFPSLPKASVIPVPDASQQQSTGSNAGSGIPATEMGAFNIIVRKTDGYVHVASADAEFFGRISGMSTTGYDEELDMQIADIRFQSSGIITLPDSIASTLNLKKDDRLFLRSPGYGMGTLNWNTISPDGTTGETLFYEFGYAISPTTIVLKKIREFVL